MKKLLSVFLILFSLSINLSCSSGDEAKNETGSIGISLENSLTKTLEPVLNMDIASYMIYGTGPNSAVFKTQAFGGSATIDNLVPGDWTVNISALNEDDIIIGTGSKITTVHAGDTSFMTITVSPIEGYGSLDLTVQWDQQQWTSLGIEAQLIPVTGSPIDLIFTHTGENTENYSGSDIPTGYYTLIIQLLNGDLSVAGRAEIVRIVDGETTTGTFEFAGINGGNIAINIDLQMNEPIPVTLTGQVDKIPPEGSMTVKANVPAEVGNVTCYWYIDGNYKAIGENYTTDSDLSLGNHDLDVTVYSADGSRAGSANHNFRKASGYYKVSYNGNGATEGAVPGGMYYEEEESVTVPGNTGNLVKPGYSFAGWNTAADGSGTAYTEGQSFIMGSENVTLYAIWAAGFVTTWKTDNPGVSEDNQVTIPVYEDETYDYTVDWGDGSTDTNVTGSITHTYESPGTYIISISGTFPGICFYDTGDKDKILTIENWGNIKWKSMIFAFWGCTNLVYNAADAPDLSGVTSMSRMFSNASSFNGDLNDWDVSSVTDISYMFDGAISFNGDISGWDVSSVENMIGMFAFASSFNGDISSWEVGKVEWMVLMFSKAISFNRDINDWDVSNVTWMGGMFAGASSFNRDLNDWDVRNVTRMEAMFDGAISFNGDISDWKVGSVTNMRNMFYGASSFNGDISGWDVDSVTNMSRMFDGATSFSGHDLSGWTVTDVTEHENFSTGWGTGNTEPDWP